MSTKQYIIQVENIVTVLRIVNKTSSVYFTIVFQRLHNPFLDKHSRDVLHEINPVSYYMHITTLVFTKIINMLCVMIFRKKQYKIYSMSVTLLNR